MSETIDRSINKATELIKWYVQQKKDFNDIDTLIHKSKDLAGVGFYLGKEVGQTKREYEAAYAMRKINESKFKNKEISIRGKSATEAEGLAIEETADLRENEKELEGIYFQGNIILNQINEVLSRMQQHISYLKQVRFSTNVTQDTQ